MTALALLSATFSLLTLIAGIILYRNISVETKDAEYMRHVGVNSSTQPAHTLANTRLGRVIAAEAAHAGLDVPLGAILAALTLYCAFAAFLATVLLSPAASIPAIALALALLFVAGRTVAARRTRSFGRQLANALPMVSQSMRAGVSIEGSFAATARYIQDPARSEFERVGAEVRFAHVPINEALAHMAERTGDSGASFLATVVSVWKVSGGDLAELLDEASEKMFAKRELQGHIDAITSQARFTSKIISVVPFLIFAIVILGSPDIGRNFLASPFALPVVGAIAILDLGAFVWIRNIYNMPID